MKKIKKIILHSIGNQDNLNFYVFDKKQNVMEILSKILWEIFEFEPLYIPGKKKVNIEKFTDIHHSDYGKGMSSRIDIFYGKKKMFVAIHCSEELRLKFNESLFKYAKMPKPKKIKPKRKVKW